MTSRALYIAAAREGMAESEERRDSLQGLVARARGGDAAAANRLWAAVGPRLLRTALALGVDPDDAADLVQDALWSAHLHLQRFDPHKATFEGWIGVILVRRVRNRWRDLRRWRRRLAAVARPTKESEDRDIRALEARLTLRRLLGRLSRRQREVVALYEIAGLQAAEVARVLGISAAGVRSLARDARRALARAVTGETSS